MELILYVSNHCDVCDVVIEHLNKLEKSFQIINLDLLHVSPPVPLFVVPALFKNSELLGYGIDICNLDLK